MQRFKTSYLNCLAVLLLMVGTGAGVQGAEIFLNPDTLYLTSAVGTEVDLTLEVDAATEDLKLFEIRFAFDPTKVETVSVAEGPLFPSGGTTVFNVYLDQNDSVLTIEGLILGYQAAVDGPGVLANIRLRVLDTGFVNLAVLSHETRDINNDPFESDASGSFIFMDFPPLSFGLIEPVAGVSVPGLPGDSISLTWQSTRSVYPGEGVTYTLEYTDSPLWEPAGVTTVAGLTDTVFWLFNDDLVSGPYYWRVTAVGDLYGYERPSTQFPDNFVFAAGAIEPDPFDLLSPDDASEMEIGSVSEVAFAWEATTSGAPNDSVWYALVLTTDPYDPGSIFFNDSILDATSMAVDTSVLPSNTWVHWSVKATNTFGLMRWANSTRTVSFNRYCCRNLTGNVNFDPDDNVDISDLTKLVNNLFVTFEPLDCPAEANVNGDVSCNIDISDLTKLVNHLFVTFEPPAACNPDCE